MVLLIAFGMHKREHYDNRILTIPMFFLALAVFFIAIKPSIGFLPEPPIEINLLQKPSISMGFKALKESPVFGSGLGTFAYDFSKYKAKEFNSSSFWGMRMNTASSKVLTLIPTAGVMGILIFLSLIVWVAYSAGKYFIFSKKEDPFVWNMALAVFIGFCILSVGFFLTGSNLTIDFLFFFFAAIMVLLISPEKKSCKLEMSSLSALFTTFLFTIIFIFGLGMLILMGQKYTAEVFYASGLRQAEQGNIDQAISSIGKAVGLNPDSDLYLRQISQLYAYRSVQIANNFDISDEEKSQAVQMLIGNAINAAKMAADVNPNNVDNWSNKGDILQSLVGAVQNAAESAVSAYDQAIILDPVNPYHLAQKAAVYLANANISEEDNLSLAREELNKALELKPDYATALYQMSLVLEAEGKTDEAIKSLEDSVRAAPFDLGLTFQLGLLYYNNESYDKAQQAFERILSLNPNYSNALYYLGLTNYKQGKSENAIENITKVLELNQDNETVKKVLSNLKAGKPPLEDINSAEPVEEGK
ncbi:tetratricopeptide repeat protein [Patescibacteria group bacterium]|nr:tetratricopeptide repeat protein [Patescibacteria group bacterium]